VVFYVGGVSVAGVMVGFLRREISARSGGSSDWFDWCDKNGYKGELRRAINERTIGERIMEVDMFIAWIYSWILFNFRCWSKPVVARKLTTMLYMPGIGMRSWTPGLLDVDRFSFREVTSKPWQFSHRSSTFMHENGYSPNHFEDREAAVTSHA
jgi:hypothetical protein